MYNAREHRKQIYNGVLVALLRQGYPAAVATLRAREASTRPLLPTTLQTGKEDVAWLQADEFRRNRHYARRICYEAEAWIQADGSSFGGEMGQRLFDVLLSGRYASGEREERLRQLRQIWQFGYHFMGRVCHELRLLRRAAFEVSPKLAEASAWPEIRRQSGIDETLAAVEGLAIGAGAVGVFPRRRVGRLPVMDTCPADMLSAWDGVIVRHRDGDVIVNDVREPAWPIWRRYSGRLRTGLYDAAPIESVEGPEYWCRDAAGMPLLETTIYRGMNADRALLPVSKQLLDGTMEIADLMLRKEWVSRVGQFERMIIAGKITNVEAAAIDPAVLLGVEGLTGDGKNSVLGTLKSAAGEFEAWNNDIGERIAMYGSQFYSGLEVQRKTDKAQSGLAIKLKTSDKWKLRADFARAALPLDQALLLTTVSLYNAQVLTGELPGYAPIPLDTWALEYPAAWTEDEIRELTRELGEEIDKGYGTATPVDILIRRGGGNPSDPKQRATAMETIERNAVEISEIRRMGLLGGPVAGATSEGAATAAPVAAPMMVGQIEGALSIIREVANGSAPREAGIARLITMIAMTPEQAEAAMGTIGAGFIPKKPEGYDPVLRESAGVDVMAVQAATALKAAGFSEAHIAAFLADRGVLPPGTMPNTPEGAAEDAAVTHTPPPQVARNASKGLRLRMEFKGRALTGLGAENDKLRARAKALRDRTPMTTGELRDLDEWLEAHKSGRDGDPNWGNDEDPSGAYITWLTQGGDEGLDWTNATLAEADAQEGPES